MLSIKNLKAIGKAPVRDITTDWIIFDVQECEDIYTFEVCRLNLTQVITIMIELDRHRNVLGLYHIQTMYDGILYDFWTGLNNIQNKDILKNLLEVNILKKIDACLQ